MNEEPLYASKCTARNLWQRYEIFNDRLELHTWVGPVKIPFETIKQVEVLPPVVKALRLHVEKCLFGLKLDAPDWSEHLVLEKNSGFMRHVLFTPENPQEFKHVLDAAVAQFREPSS